MDIADILTKCRNGDREAWNMLINAYSKSVYNIALNFFAERDIASDVTQEIFIKLYHNLEKYREEKSFTSWIFAISRNYCIDYWRKNKKYMANSQELDENISSGQMTPEENLSRESEIELLRKKISQLEPDLRLILILRDIHDLSYQEIADRFSIPEGTVKSRINRARLKLAEAYMRGGS
ncbi:MAG: RNA polymerase sigma factor [candidate division Zixibacteria bacterium]|nr:RNA polymerase sigma factor [candidate division Zixibacteria bacterium]